MSTSLNDVQKLSKKYSTLWNDMDTDLSSVQTYSFLGKRAVKKEINESINILLSQIKDIPTNKKDKDKWQNELKATLTQRAKFFLGIKTPEFEEIMIKGFICVAEEFIDQAKSFDKNIPLADIAQAIRNVWIMNIIQAIDGKDIAHTPSVFAYSMLYPYTDNFLDNPDISIDDKKLFNQRLGKRLEGEDIAPEKNETQIYELISMIETQYSRKDYPQVFESILCIHLGQCKSLVQQNILAVSSEKSILEISTEKGGASVLADAYLVCGDLDEKLSDLMFGFGFVLQLADDLQDAVEDFENNHMTVFSRNVKTTKLDELTNKLITFTIKALDFENYKKSPYILDIKNLIIDKTLMIIFQAVWDNRKLYTKSYIRNFKKYTPFNYRYLSRKIKKLKKELRKLESFSQQFI